MKVLLLALITSLFSLSITPVSKIAGNAEKRRLANTIRSFYAISSVACKSRHSANIPYALNNVVNYVITTGKHSDEKLQNVELLKTKTLKSQNPQIEKFRL